MVLATAPHAGSADWDSFALRLAAYEPGVDCVIVGGLDPRHVERKVAAVAAGPLPEPLRDELRRRFLRLGRDWYGQV